MRLLKFGVMVSSVLFTCLPAIGAQAGECTKIAAAGDGPTKYIATIMSTHGLDNIIEARGMKGRGPVHTTCKPGTFLVECRSSQTACK